jgi:hypothetical protein
MLSSERTSLSFSPQNAVDHADEQKFSHWSSQRLGLYQQAEQQVQEGIANLVQLANDLKLRMEEESKQMIEGYRQQRTTLQSEIDSLRVEEAALRKSLADERALHEADLAKTFTQETQRLDALRAATSQDCAQMIARATEERDRIITESRHLSTQLASLQQALQQIASVSAFLPTVPSAPMPQPVVAQPVSPARPVEQAVAPQPLIANEVVVQPPVQIEPVLPAQSVEPAPADVDPLPVQEHIPTGLPQVEGFHLYIEQVGNMLEASALIDQLKQIEGIRRVTLVHFEAQLLHISLNYTGEGAALEQIITESSGGALLPLSVDRHTLRMRRQLRTIISERGWHA